MKTFGCIALAGVLLLGGCASSAAPSESLEPSAAPSKSLETYDMAMTKCVAMASEAMPNGMRDPSEPAVVLDSKQFCDRLADGYSRAKFTELYNDPEWLANELEIWSGEGVP